MAKTKQLKWKRLCSAKSICTCCKIEYYKGNVLSGFTIVQIKKDYPDTAWSIDIPASEIPNLIKVAKQVLKMEAKDGRNG